MMLTGDNASTAQAVANQVGIADFHAGVLPSDKAEVVRALKSRGIVTGMVGGFIAGLYRQVSEFLNPLVVFFNAISGIVVSGRQPSAVAIGPRNCRSRMTSGSTPAPCDISG